MKHKVSELTGALLDAAVAKAEGYEFHALSHLDWPTPGPKWLLRSAEDQVQRFIGDSSAPQGMIWLNEHSQAWRFAPSIAWEHGGPIIEREHLRVEWHSDGGGFWRSVRPAVVIGDWPISKNGSTALEAAMRAYVASKTGDEVELP